MSHYQMYIVVHENGQKWKPWVSGSKCRQDLLVNKFVYMTKIRADMSYLGGRLVPLVEVTD